MKELKIYLLGTLITAFIGLLFFSVGCIATYYTLVAQGVLKP